MEVVNLHGTNIFILLFIHIIHTKWNIHMHALFCRSNMVWVVWQFVASEISCYKVLNLRAKCFGWQCSVALLVAAQSTYLIENTHRFWPFYAQDKIKIKKIQFKYCSNPSSIFEADSYVKAKSNICFLAVIIKSACTLQNVCFWRIAVF